MEDKLRSCTCRVYNHGVGWSKPFKAKFHCWGLDSDEDTQTNWTIAIVEDEQTGETFKVLVGEIMFVQSPEKLIQENEKLIGEESFSREQIGNDLDIAISRCETLAPKSEQIHSLISVLKNIRRRI